MYNVADSAVMFPAWNALWEGALAVHNRDLVLIAERGGDSIRWQIAPRS